MNTNQLAGNEVKRLARAKITAITNQLIEKKINELATQAIPQPHLDSFLALNLKAKISGIGAFAVIAGDVKVAEMCKKMLEEVQ